LTPSAGAALAALVSISVAPDDVPPELSALAVRSCDTALGEGKCQLEGPAPAEWHATVSTSDPNLTNVRIEVRKESSSSAPEVRDLSFSPEDSVRERWASVGVVIAALVVARSRESEPQEAPAPVAPPPPPPPIARPTPRPVAAPPPRIFRFDLRMLGARRTSEGLPEIGLELGASLLPGAGPAFVGVSIAGAHRLGADVGASWFSGAAGGGVRVGRASAQFACEFRGAIVVEYWRFEASEPGRSEHSGKFRVGGLAGVDALWAMSSKWILSLGVEGLVVGPSLRVDVEGKTVETIPRYGGAVLAGVRFFP
jgi:hypothetical protein